MLDLLRLGSFKCPNCNELMNTSMEKCPRCSQPVDRQFAVAAAEIQEKVYQAYNDAKYIRYVAVAHLWLEFTALAAVFGITAGFLSIVAIVAFPGTFIALLVMTIRWQSKFGQVVTNDELFGRAKKQMRVAVLILLASILAVPIVLMMVKAGMRPA